MLIADWLVAKLILGLAALGPPGRRAQSMVEYSIIAAVIAIVALAAVSGLGKELATAFGKIAGQVSGAASCNGC
jgi:Flp pilus assembly pilin Flp